MSSNFLKLFQTQNNRSPDYNLSTTKRFSFDDLGDFIEERERVKRRIEKSTKTELKVDYSSSFSNHTFFNSAVSKFAVAKDRVLEQYPFDGDTEEKDAFFLSGTGYENYIYNNWPRSVGYLELNGTSQFVTASDFDNKLLPGTSSVYVSAWIKPKVTNLNAILQVVSASSTTVKMGYEMFLTGATEPYIKFILYSGSNSTTLSAAYSAFTASFNNVAVIYDNPSNLLSLYINSNMKVSASVGYGSIEFAPTRAYIGSGSRHGSSGPIYSFYSGSIDEVRILHSGTDLYHTKNYNRYINAEDYVKLYYKFNEGVVGTASIDTGVVDYSKSALHGAIVNYASTARVSGTSLLEDTGDPILYSYHSSVVSFSSSIELTASAFDRDNKNLIFRLIPEDVMKLDDEADGIMRTFSLAMARYFDEMKLYIDQFDNLRITNYDDVDETPDLFLPMLKRYFGWKVTDHYGDAAPLEFFYGENILTPSSGNLTTSLSDIRNQFWRRTLNNLPYLLKTKGKRNNLDSFFNVLGINKNNLSVKEFGYVNKSSIENARLHKEKVAYMLGIGTGSLGSLSSSFVKVPSLVSTANNIYTVESMLQLPHASAAYSSSVITGSVWQFVDSNQATGSFSLLWRVQSLGSPSGSFILTGSDGQKFSSSIVTVFDGRITNVAAGLKNDQKPFIEIRLLDNDTLTSSSFVGTTAFSGIFTGSKFDFIIGASSGTFFTKQTQGNFGEFRYWTRALSASEMDSHAYHFESVGVDNPLTDLSKLKGHWALNENYVVNSIGRINSITDLSRNNMYATGIQFTTDINPYRPYLLEYNYLSPTVDLKWTDNKIRIRNKTELTLSDIATDTNEVSLEFNLVDALNEDISKIFSALDIMNNVVGNPINKYRDEYADLEFYRRVYFDRLSDSVNFTRFFRLFRWFDKKLSDSIKQLLPARTKFIGGEQVVESHFLERNKYGYKYPIFRTPKDIQEGVIQGFVGTSGSNQAYMEASQPTMGTYPRSVLESQKKFTSFGQINGYAANDANVIGFWHLDQTSLTQSLTDSSVNATNAVGAYLTLSSPGALTQSGLPTSLNFSAKNSPLSGAIDLSASLKYINPGSNKLVSGTIEFYFKAFDVAVWASGSTQPLMVLGESGLGDNDIEITFNQTTPGMISYYFACNAGLDQGLIEVAMPGDVNWHHYAVTFDSGSKQFKAYLDGVLQGSSATFSNWNNPAAYFKVSANDAYSDGGPIGYYDEIRVSNVVRDIPSTWTTYTTRVGTLVRSPSMDVRPSSVVTEAEVSPSEIVTAYADGDDRVNRISMNTPGFFARKISGNTRNDNNNPNTSMNMKNHFARRILTQLEVDNKDGYRSGSFISRKLGNGFAFKGVESARDQAHYFGDHKKHIAMRWWFLSGNAATNATSLESDFAITGQNGLPLSASLYDSNNTLIARGDGRQGFGIEPSWFSAAFGVPASGAVATQSTKMIGPTLSCLVSASAVPFADTDIDFLAVLNTPGTWESLKPFGTFSTTPDDHGFYEFSINYDLLLQRTSDDILFTYQAPLIVLSCSSVAATYTFRQFKIDFSVRLTNAGVEYFTNVDNQNQEFSYINTKLFRKVDL